MSLLMLHDVTMKQVHDEFCKFYVITRSFKKNMFFSFNLL